MRFLSRPDEFERTFITRMERLQREGYDFQGGVRMALEAKFGGAADVLVRGMSDDVRQNPAWFAGALSHKFGRGASVFFEPVLKWADRDLFPLSMPGQSAYGAIAGGLPPGGNHDEQKTTSLHEHRVKDDEGKYSDEYD